MLLTFPNENRETLFAALALGLLISTVAATREQAWNTAFFFIMRAIAFSGFGTPISSTPVFFQNLSFLNPLRHVVLILRSIYLKGVGRDVLWPNIAVMAILALVLLTVSDLRFEKSLD